MALHGLNIKKKNPFVTEWTYFTQTSPQHPSTYSTKAYTKEEEHMEEGRPQTKVHSTKEEAC